MESVVWVPMAAAGVGIALWLVAFRRKNRSSRPTAPRNRMSPGVGSLERTPADGMRRFPDLGANFEALSIQIPHHPCQAARELRGQRFLAEEMPELPLPGCDRECECTFIYHRERRDEQNRRAPYLSADDGDNDFESLEHRSSSDRRKR
ncbi:MAG: hypothetical protein V3U00_05480 [Gammaproteobacteria bacterium]|jgi:hypothetical protein